MIFWYCIHFICSITLIGFWCPILSTPCNFERFYIGDSACSNCFNKVLIFFKSCPCTLWDQPHPHARMLMTPNNMSEVKHTNKGCCTSCICCAWVWSSSHLNFIFLKLDQRPSFHSIFALHVGCSKYKHSWKCGLVA